MKILRHFDAIFMCRRGVGAIVSPSIMQAQAQRSHRAGECQERVSEGEKVMAYRSGKAMADVPTGASIGLPLFQVSCRLSVRSRRPSRPFRSAGYLAGRSTGCAREPTAGGGPTRGRRGARSRKMQCPSPVGHALPGLPGRDAPAPTGGRARDPCKRGPGAMHGHVGGWSAHGTEASITPRRCHCRTHAAHEATRDVVGRRAGGVRQPP